MTNQTRAARLMPAEPTDREAIRKAVEQITELQRRPGGDAWREAQGLLSNGLTFVAQGLIDQLARVPPAAQPPLDATMQASEQGVLDAARYRWLKGMKEDFDNMAGASYYATKLSFTLHRLEWDAAIDAAIEAKNDK